MYLGSMEDDRPFACPISGCCMRFTNEDHLMVHKKKHEMSLNLSACTKNSAMIYADQTPTPTRFIRNCEEVGLFQDLQNINPFDDQFRKAAESKGPLILPEPLFGAPTDLDSLNTPAILVDDVEMTNNQLVPLDASLPDISTPSGVNDHIAHQMSEKDVDEEAVIQQIEESMAQEIEATKSDGFSSAIDTAVLPQDLSVMPLPANNTFEKPLPIPQDMSMTMGERMSTAPSPAKIIRTGIIKPTINNALQPDQKMMMAKAQNIPMGLPMLAPANNHQQHQQPPSMVQIVLKLPDGRSIPVQIPTNAAVTSEPSSMNPTNGGMNGNVAGAAAAALTKFKLKQVLSQSQNSSSLNIPKVIPKPLQNNDLDCMDPDSFMNSPPANYDMNQDDLLFINDTLSRRRQQQQQQQLRPSSGAGSGDDDPDEKRKKFLERNRAAAMRCRMKRKRWIQNLEIKAEELNFTNHQLQGEVSMLRTEVAHLKAMLLAHKDCPVTQQQQQQRNQQQQQQQEVAAATSAAAAAISEMTAEELATTVAQAQAFNSTQVLRVISVGAQSASSDIILVQMGGDVEKKEEVVTEEIVGYQETVAQPPEEVV